MDTSKILNNAYHAAVLSGLVITNSMVSKKILNMKQVNLNRISMKDGAMLTLNVYVATTTKDFLISKGILPADLNIPK